MKRTVMNLATATAVLLSLTSVAMAQVAPFDMSIERPATPEPTPQITLPSTVPGASQSASPTPLSPAQPTAQTPAQTPAQTQVRTPVPTAQTPGVAQPPGTRRRYIIPGREFTLSGEYDRSTWSIYLTEGEASSPARLQFAYQNAVVVAPEASEVTITINGHRLTATPISSADSVRATVLDVPSGMLQPGSNQIDIRASQRHRTDCDVRSTYDLWTSFDTRQTYLEFSRNPESPMSTAEAVRSVGVDETGGTSFRILMPALGQPGATSSVMRLAQGLSLIAGMPNQTFSFSASEMPSARPGRFGVVIGTAAELQGIFPHLPQAASLTAVAAIVPAPQGDGNILLISGPSWEAIMAAVDTVVAVADQPTDIRRDVIATQRWASPDAPLFFGGEKLSLSQMGVETVEFPGRRVKAKFNIAVPADFYANAYGEAVLLLDAAFADSVRPGSHIDIYINNNIASTAPITAAHGGILRHLPIKVPLRHIRPGVNAISIEAVLLADEDATCIPGATASKDPRFALFDTSEWQMPRFARVGQSPSLSALAGTGFPYSRDTDPLVLSIDRLDSDTLSAAATVVARLALVAGRLLPVESAPSPGAVGERNALFIGSISQMPPKLLSQLNISPGTITSWRPAGPLVTQEGASTDTFDQWRSRVSGGAWRGQISSLQEWMHRNFDISLASLQFLPQSDVVFEPSAQQSLLVAQGRSPQGEATWTMVAAPTPADLRLGTDALAQEAMWRKISGRLTAYAAKTAELVSMPANRFDLVETQPRSLNNYRLIAANWLSTNILSYAVVFITLSLLLGIVTASLLSTLGRRP
ncbi:cellulose biosynthesis cyclic di-GMP-binding regulatory protein BcsB [Rhizobium daejeonense]